MDFTLRMHQDLNTIWFETAFLQKSHAKIKLDLEQLFTDYTKPIGYFTSLAACRNADGWSCRPRNPDNSIPCREPRPQTRGGHARRHPDPSGLAPCACSESGYVRPAR